MLRLQVACGELHTLALADDSEVIRPHRINRLPSAVLAAVLSLRLPAR